MLLEAQEAETQADLVTRQARIRSPEQCAVALSTTFILPGHYTIGAADKYQQAQPNVRPSAGSSLQHAALHVCLADTGLVRKCRHRASHAAVCGATGRGSTGGAGYRGAAACGAGPA